MHLYLQPVKYKKIAVLLLFPTHLSARFVPLVHKECALEDEVFEDGAETQMECNKCVCACGNWVCTALACNGGFVPVCLWCRNAKGMGFTFLSSASQESITVRSWLGKKERKKRLQRKSGVGEWLNLKLYRYNSISFP